jgi:hypothetical protein
MSRTDKLRPLPRASLNRPSFPAAPTSTCRIRRGKQHTLSPPHPSPPLSSNDSILPRFLPQLLPPCISCKSIRYLLHRFLSLRCLAAANEIPFTGTSRSGKLTGTLLTARAPDYIDRGVTEVRRSSHRCRTVRTHPLAKSDKMDANVKSGCRGSGSGTQLTRRTLAWPGYPRRV